MTPHDRLKALGLELFTPPTPIGNFRNFVRSGPLLFISGQGPLDADGTLHTGKVGQDVDVAAAYQHARLAGLNILSTLSAGIGDLSQVKQVVKLLGFVNATPEFIEHPKVINGCSDLFVDVFGDIGMHARAAIGVGSLPNNITVEIEAIIEIHS
ncbi:RidA family protein [Rhizobium mayense]|uniref:RidA family protein n=1 Tax=Rhizobium mayense TaxID=1312184 RepID=A0ABT7JRY9_9HYPH|nr:RidA family protein [Rhizobium mayense]MDL2397943.1 RidA family protein [Rhizobium mayense]